MSVVTAIPWHVYVVMLAFSLLIGLLVAIDLRDRAPSALSVERSSPVNEPQRGAA